MLNIVPLFILPILYCRKCEGVSKTEGCRGTSCCSFLEALVLIFLVQKVVHSWDYAILIGAFVLENERFPVL
jgi:hypothetical protein